MTKRPQGKGLGRGLSALLADVPDEEEVAEAPRAVPDAVAPVDLIRPNPAQPRKSFREDELDELAASIREKGVIQPLIVRPDPDNEGGFQIVAGERRWRAAQRAQLHEVPVVVRKLSDSEVLELAIIENIQREDLNAIEEAAGFSQLMQSFGHTQERMAEAMGKSRSYIANALRLLSLPKTVQEHVRAGRLSAGHARALVAASDPEKLAEIAIARGLSVRATEQLVKQEKAPRAAPPPRREKDADTRALESDLSANLGLKVQIEHKGESGGEVRLRYRSLDELDGICQLLSR